MGLRCISTEPRPAADGSALRMRHMNSGSIAFNADLMRRYDREGPRYTSYPTARQFRGGLLPGDYEQAVRSSEGALRADPLSVYVHLPFCYSPCFYCGCNRVITHELDRVDAYVRNLLREIALRSAISAANVRWNSCISAAAHRRFCPRNCSSKSSTPWIGICNSAMTRAGTIPLKSTPGASTTGLFSCYRPLGFNRISLGVQDFDENVQRAVNRVQSAELVERTYESARALGFGSINFDLIYGLPLQTLSTSGRRWIE
jgi:oxygen-independent coproporphyrinogen-3 oxidase